MSGNLGTNSAQAHSLSKTEVSVLKHNYLVSKHTVAWHNGKGRWTLYPKYLHCSMIKKDRPAGICFKHRHILKAHAARMGRIYLILHPPVVDWLDGAFACIHRYEGAWDSNTGNGYYGGLQMDLTFQSLYGRSFLIRWGTADNWPVWAQIQAAKNAYHSGRGFNPWPNTAKICGY